MLGCLDGLYGYAMALTHDPTEAEDLVQETYMRAALHCEKLRPDSNVKAWMFTIMRNRWFKQLRHENSGPEFVALDDTAAEGWMADSDHEPGHLCERIWERDEIRTALKQLPVAQREIIVLRDIEGFSYRELAEMLELPDRHDHVAARSSARQIQDTAGDQKARRLVANGIGRDLRRWRPANPGGCG